MSYGTNLIASSRSMVWDDHEGGGLNFTGVMRKI